VGSVLASAEEDQQSIPNSPRPLKLLSLPAAQQEAELLMGDPLLFKLFSKSFRR
jgi:hypothetical protein